MSSTAHIIRRRRRRKQQQQQEQQRTVVWLGLVGMIALIAFVIPVMALFLGAFTAYGRALNRLPQPQETIALGAVGGTTEMYDSAGQTLLFAVSDPLGNNRTWMTLGELPDYVSQATVLQEDAGFLERADDSFIAMTGRLLDNWLNGPLSAEYSLTARLVRNVIAPPPDFVTADDRALEIALISEINRRYSPQEILEWHLNTNYYGNEAYGIESAAQVYLGKSARDLTLDEAALLAAIPTEPRHNPVDDEVAARGRQSALLRQMLAAGVIGQSQFEAAINVQTRIRPDAGQQPTVAPEFALYARRQAENILTAMGMDGAQLVSRGGVRIITTLDLDLYYQVDCILRTHLARLAGSVNTPLATLEDTECFSAVYLPDVLPLASSPPDTGAVVILDAQTGVIRAMVGDAVRPVYQPGPMLHPFVYLDGFINTSPNYTAATMLLDIPNHVFPGASDGLIYQPQNSDNQFRGPISLRDAMGAGLLPPAVQVANVLNLNNILRDTVYQIGINSLRDGVYDLSLLERGGAVSVLDMAYAYSVFAAEGSIKGLQVIPRSSGLRNHDPVAVQRIEDAEGNVLWEYQAHTEPRLQREVAYLVNDVLADQSTRWATLGQGNVLELNRTAAVVNGITGDRLNSWTIGYTPQLVVAVRLGRADSLPTALPGFGIEGAAPIWRAVLDYLHIRDNIPPEDWARPDTIAQTQVCEISGGRPNNGCDTREEIFLDAGQFPPPDTYWQEVEINIETGQRANVNTPVALRQTRRYFVPPSDAMDWWQANNRPLPPQEYDLASRPDILSSAVILQPEDLDIVGGQVTVSGSIDAENMRYYQVAYGAGQNPSELIDITGQQEAFSPGTPLANWDTTALASGTYVLRLSVVLDDGTVDRDTVQVIVDNIAPQLILSSDKQVYQWPDDEVIALRAEVTDNIRYNRVEFYYGGTFVGSDVEFPFEYNHRINRTGQEQFTAVAFDSVGNNTTAEIFVEVVRSGG